MSAESFIVQGNANLSGEHCSGCQERGFTSNQCLLPDRRACGIGKCSDILDVRKLITLIKGLGVRIDRIDANTYRFQADNIDLEYFVSDAFQQDAQRIPRLCTAHRPPPGPIW